MRALGSLLVGRVGGERRAVAGCGGLGAEADLVEIGKEGVVELLWFHIIRFKFRLMGQAYYLLLEPMGKNCQLPGPSPLMAAGAAHLATKSSRSTNRPRAGSAPQALRCSCTPDSAYESTLHSQHYVFKIRATSALLIATHVQPPFFLLA